MRPFDRQARRKVPNSCLCCIVWCLRLGNVDHGTGHGANHDHAAFCLSLQQMTGDACREQICAIHIHPPQLLQSVVGVSDRVKVLGETSGGDEVVDFAMIPDDLLD